MSSPQIQFRAIPPLDAELRQRAPSGDLSYPARRDLERYYELLHLTLATMKPKLSVNEACLVVDALNGVLLRSESISLLWANVAKAIATDGLAQKWEVDGDGLVSRLLALSYFELMAVGDAIERAWGETYHVHDMRERVVNVGLAEREAS